MYRRQKGIDWDAVALGAASDVAIAHVGVAPQVVNTARRRRGIPRYDADAVARRSTIEWARVGLGDRPDSVIASDLGMTCRSVCYERRRRGIPPFVGLILTQEGEPCRSIY